MPEPFHPHTAPRLLQPFRGACCHNGCMRTHERDAEFREFYSAHVARLRRLALMMVGDRSRADDLAHDALLRCYVSWHRIRGDDPAPYVTRTLVNLCRNAHRRRAVEIRKAPPPPPDVVDRSDRVDEALRVAAALSVLSPVRRAVVLLRFYDDMSESDIAMVLDRPLNTVKSDLRRALERLRPVLEENTKEPR